MNLIKKFKILKKHLGNPYLKPWENRQTAQIIKASLYADLENLHHVEHVPILLVGLQGFGKTSLINWLIRKIRWLYRPYEQNTLFTNSLEYNMKHMTSAPIQNLVTDDAIEHQDSTNYISSTSKEAAHAFFKIRHIYENRFPESDRAILFTITSTQLYKALDPRFRQARLVFFKNTLLDKEKNMYMIYQIGFNAWKWLDAVSDWRSSLESLFAQYFILKKGNNAFYGSFTAPRKQLKCQYVTSMDQVKDKKREEFLQISLLRNKGIGWKGVQKILKNEENPVTFRTRFTAQLNKYLDKWKLLVSENA